MLQVHHRISTPEALAWSEQCRVPLSDFGLDYVPTPSASWTTDASPSNDHEAGRPERAERQAMVRQQLAARGVVDQRVLEAFATVPRERFVPAKVAPRAYEDRALPIGEGQTISQPFVVATMAEALTIGPTDRVLEVGAGSGYAAAILGRLAAHVMAVERVPVLAERARVCLAEIGADNVEIVVGDGSVGVADAGPFDAVCVSASAPAVPEALLALLAPGGRLVAPVGGRSDDQQLVRVRRTAAGDERDNLGSVRFVPLIGEQGW